MSDSSDIENQNEENYETPDEGFDAANNESDFEALLRQKSPVENTNTSANNKSSSKKKKNSVKSESPANKAAGKRGRPSKASNSKTAAKVKQEIFDDSDNEPLNGASDDNSRASEEELSEVS